MIQGIWRASRFPRGLRPMFGSLVLVGGVLVGCGACSGTQRPGDDPAADRAQGETPVAATDSAPALALGPITKSSMREHPAQNAWRFDHGAEPRKISVGEAEAQGYTVVDLGDSWVPYIFSEKTPGQPDESPNLYRTTYIDLANDRIDSDGERLRPHQHNFLEPYGIPPTLSVIMSEWEEIEKDVQPCLERSGFDPSVFATFTGTIAFEKGKERKYAAGARWWKASLEKAMRKARLDPNQPESWEAAADHPKTRLIHRKWREHQGPLDVIVQAQRRFRCEKLFEKNGGRGTFAEGEFDFETTHALAAFEKKHDVLGWGHFTPENIKVLGRSPAETVHARLLRTVQERVVAGAGVVEDGSAARWKPNFRWKDEHGSEHALRDLAAEFTEVVVQQLGFEDAERARKSLARLSDLGEGGFSNLLVAVELPKRPEYYSEDMEFDVVIDRGDVWYDFPYDEQGNRLLQPRRRFPHMTVYTLYHGQKIPVVHWRTTIGSWRSELKDGETWFKYKNSDVGKRVWKDIVAAPTWIPPATTPPAELLKRRWKDGAVRLMVNYDEMGPGYKSAYGLVAAFHIKPVYDEEGNIKVELDNQIRTHGSVDYMSILRRFSHGCHRLYNMNAVRLFSFILQHRTYRRLGQENIGFRRMIQHEDQEFRIAIDTRGYKYELEKPIPVLVTEGNIKGKRKRPIEEYIRKPGQLYKEDLEQIESLIPFF